MSLRPRRGSYLCLVQQSLGRISSTFDKHWCATKHDITFANSLAQRISLLTTIPFAGTWRKQPGLYIILRRYNNPKKTTGIFQLSKYRSQQAHPAIGLRQQQTEVAGALGVKQQQSQPALMGRQCCAGLCTLHVTQATGNRQHSCLRPLLHAAGISNLPCSMSW